MLHPINQQSTNLNLNTEGEVKSEFDWDQQFTKDQQDLINNKGIKYRSKKEDQIIESIDEGNMLDALNSLGQTTKQVSSEVKNLLEVTDKSISKTIG